MSTAPFTKKSRPALSGVQALRGFAASMVVIFHATSVWSVRVNGSASAGWTNGSAGVDIFFVISGLVMAISTIGLEHPLRPARDFLTRRLIRICPLYWAATIGALLLLKASHAGDKESFGYVVSSFLFLPCRNIHGEPFPILNAGWTLSFEMFFYLLFALALAMRISVARLLTPVMISLAVLGLFRTTHWIDASLLLNPLLLEFLMGLLLGHFLIKGYRMPWKVALLIGIPAIAMILTAPVSESPWLRFASWGIPAALIVHMVVMLEGRFGSSYPPWLLTIGDASYSLYLLHTLIQGPLSSVLLRVHLIRPGHLNEIFTVTLLLGTAIISSVVSFRAFEKPINTYLRKRLLEPRIPVSPAVSAPV
jgi:exopolysaccharide production protein ExoZ